MFRGSIAVAEQGASFTLGLRMVVSTPKSIKGTLSGKFNAGGASCKMSREFTAKFAGK